MKIDNRRYNYKEVIKVDSPAPLSDGMAGSQWIYIPLIITLFGLLIYYIIRIFVADAGLTQLRKKVRFYKPPISFTTAELITAITPQLMSMGMTVTLSKNDTISVSYKGMIYDINFYGDNYGIWWRKSVGHAFFSVDGDITKYKKAVVAMGIIAYTVQTVLEKKAAEQTKQGTVNEG